MESSLRKWGGEAVFQRISLMPCTASWRRRAYRRSTSSSRRLSMALPRHALAAQAALCDVERFLALMV
jgi:hypothetical protein